MEFRVRRGKKNNQKMIWVKYLDTEVEECWHSAEETRDWMELRLRPPSCYYTTVMKATSKWATILLLQVQPLAWLEKTLAFMVAHGQFYLLAFSNEPASPEWRLCDRSKDSSSSPRSSSLLRLLSLEGSLSPLSCVPNVCPAFSQPPGFLTSDVLMLSYESYFY